MRLFLILCGFALAGASSAAAAPAPVMKFALPGSDGYTLQVKTDGAQTLISASREGQRRSSTYYVSESAGEGTIDAELGALGRIDVRFEPSGETRTVDRCRGERRAVRRLGVFTGTISFRGENGYTVVEASQAPGSVGPSMRGRCRGGGTAAASSARTAARRQIEHVWAIGDATLMNRNSITPGEDNMTLLLAVAEGRLARYLVNRIEVPRPGLTIERRVEVVGPRAGFSYPHDYRTAVLRPPKPFSGEATYSAGSRQLAGDLRIAFLGLAPQSLTGHQFEARILPED
jgi:hypothetical protein